MLHDKVDKAIKVLKMFEPENEPYFLCYSGGKDSDCVRILAELANVKFDLVHNLTTVDTPETIQYIKSIPNVIFNKAHYKDGSPKTMWNLIPKKFLPPTRLLRYCCMEFKEQGGKGRLKLTGVRASESFSRSENSGDIKIIGKRKTTESFFIENNIEYHTTKKSGLILNFDSSDSRRAVEHCYRTTSTLINPIINWSESDVWEFLHYYGCESNPLYKCGFGRIGCIGCPLGGYKSMKKEFRLYPKYKDLYIHTFDKMLKSRIESDKPTDWKSGEEVFNWWLDINSDQLLFGGFDYLDV